ncbi:hypothetical protein D3C85_1546740 [compost metagenome]
MSNANIRRRNRVYGIGLAGAVENRASNLFRDRREVHVDGLGCARPQRYGGRIILRAGPCAGNTVIFGPAAHNDGSIVLVAQHLGEQKVRAKISPCSAVSIDEDINVLTGLKLRFERAESVGTLPRHTRQSDRQAKSKTDH